VRYFEEIPGQPVLDFIERGVDTFIGTADYGLPSNFTGNITDICPVGALLDGVARFRGRNWEYDHQITTDLTDASGSGIMVDSRGGQIERIRAFERREVNQAWISDAARFGHGWVRQDRLTTPLIREGDRLVPASWDQAFAALQEGLAGIEAQEIGLYLAGTSSLEEGYAAAHLASKLGTPHLDFAGRGALSAGSFLPASFSEILGADLVLVVGNPTEELPILHLWLQQFLKGLELPPVYDHGTAFADLNIKERMPRQKAKLALFSPYPTPLGEVAGV
jgi:NADH-quinone oxidoreductase subunit G